MAGNKYRFNQFDIIGGAGAEEDKYLSDCFIDTGYINVLKDMSDCRQIILGRTGAGKSALLAKMKEDETEKVIDISPESLALTYVSNSTILNFFSSIGVNLDPFFKLLWRHVLTVEILSKHFETEAPNNKKGLVDHLLGCFSGANKKDKQSLEAIKYLQSWGKTFWEETEYRVKEITKTLENQLKSELSAKLGVDGAGIEFSAGDAHALTVEEKATLHDRGQQIVAKAQIQDLSKVIQLLDSVLSDRQKKYYVVIDKLDENWVEDSLRYKLIMALIVTLKDLTRVSNAKVIITMRRDLIDRVFRLTRSSGFQEEKFESLFLPIKWEEGDLINLLDARVSKLVSSKYTTQKVTHKDLLPKSIHGMSVTDYLLARVRRPRDIIDFFNRCIMAGTSMTRLTVEKFKTAEGEYSRGRLRALGDEWSADFPSLLEFVEILNNKAMSFKVSLIEDSLLEELCLRVAAENPSGSGLLQASALTLIDGGISIYDFKKYLVGVLYRVGLVGLKLAAHQTVSWVDQSGPSISSAEISDQCSLVIHPMYYRALGIKVSF